MTLVLSALVASVAVALIVGPWHRPLPVSRPAPPRLDLAAAQRFFDGRAMSLAAGLIAGGAGFVAGGPLVAAAVALASIAAVRALRARRAGRLAAERRTLTEGLLDALSAELVSGAAPADAVAAVARDLPPAVRIELDFVLRALRSGGDAAAAWGEVRAITNAGALSAVFRVCEDTGASLATVLTRLATVAADDRRRREEVELALAGPRSSAVLLAALPALGVLAGAGLGASPLPFLLHTPVGHLCCFVGVGLDVLGAWWVSRLAAAAGRPPRLT